MMRGIFGDQGQLVSYISPEQRIAAAPPPHHTCASTRGVGPSEPRFPHAVFHDGGPVDPARTVAECAATPGVGWHPE